MDLYAIERFSENGRAHCVLRRARYGEKDCKGSGGSVQIVSGEKASQDRLHDYLRANRYLKKGGDTHGE